MLLIIVHYIFIILFFYIAAATVYFFVIAVAGKIKKAPVYASVPDKKKIAVFIPSYKEDNIITGTAAKAKLQSYPQNLYDVFVIADHLQKSTVEKLIALPVNVAEVMFEVSMKAKSINHAVNLAAGKGYDIAMVLDADNIMSPDCLEKINHAFSEGYKAVQCHRVAKNKNNAVAILDVISEEINNHLFRRGQRALGFSSSLIGSGMAFEFETFRKIFNLPEILNNPGEDREIDLQLMKDDIEIEFIDDAYVYDEKVSSAAVFEKQRLRWLEAQLNNFLRFFDKDVRSHSNRKSYWYKLFQTALLPRSLYLLIFVLIVFIFFLELILGIRLIYPHLFWWAGALGLYLLALAISIPKHLYNKDMVKAIANLPMLLISMLRALFRMKSNRKEFLHTPKVHTGDQQ
ncbi:MAG: glycosyltransferase family 2 protein [Bacteroidetes bacterium]|nr:glycosyltransferase family 2 protein [Bacteroidota bacterium]